MKGIRALVSAGLAALTLVALAVPATAAPGDLEQNIVVQGNAVYLRTKYTPRPEAVLEPRGRRLHGRLHQRGHGQAGASPSRARVEVTGGPLVWSS
jgi:hypothetical protein